MIQTSVYLSFPMLWMAFCLGLSTLALAEDQHLRDGRFIKKQELPKNAAGYRTFGSGAEGPETVFGTIRVIKAPNEHGYVRLQFSHRYATNSYIGIDIPEADFNEKGVAYYRLDGIAAGRYYANAVFEIHPSPQAGSIRSDNLDVVVEEGVGAQDINFICNQRRVVRGR